MNSAAQFLEVRKTQARKLGEFGKKLVVGLGEVEAGLTLFTPLQLRRHPALQSLVHIDGHEVIADVSFSRADRAKHDRASAHDGERGFQTVVIRLVLHYLRLAGGIRLQDGAQCLESG